jgi:hypothetical protein
MPERDIVGRLAAFSVSVASHCWTRRRHRRCRGYRRPRATGGQAAGETQLAIGQLGVEGADAARAGAAGTGASRAKIVRVAAADAAAEVIAEAAVARQRIDIREQHVDRRAAGGNAADFHVVASALVELRGRAGEAPAQLAITAAEVAGRTRSAAEASVRRRLRMRGAASPSG